MAKPELSIHNITPATGVLNVILRACRCRLVGLDAEVGPENAEGDATELQEDLMSIVSCLPQVMTASVQHRIAVDEHKRLQQQAAEKRRAKNQVTKKLTLEQIAAAEVKRCEKVKKREAMDNDEIKNLVALCGF